ncbi:MAG TPA: hypothetical protein VGL75_02610 [Acidothermaceae bacterium]
MTDPADMDVCSPEWLALRTDDEVRLLIQGSAHVLDLELFRAAVLEAKRRGL